MASGTYTTDDQFTSVLSSYISSDQLACAAFPMQAGQQAAAAEAWCANAAAWAERLSSSYPGYRDLTQPVALAVHEARRGFATMAAAADISMPHGRSSAVVRHTDVGGGGDEVAARLEGILRALMAFPAALRAHEGPAAVELASSGAQGLVAHLAAASTVGNQHLLSRATQCAVSLQRAAQQSVRLVVRQIIGIPGRNICCGCQGRPSHVGTAQ